MKRSTEAERRGGFEANEDVTHEKRPRHRPCPPAEIVCRISSCRKSKKKKMSDCVPYKRSYAVSPRTRAPKKSLSVPRSLCCSTFDRVGRQKTPREASRARARLGRRQRRCRAWVSKCRSVDLRRRRPRSAPIRRIWRDGFRRSACAEWPDTREYRGGRGGVARDARGEGSDRQTGSARHVSVLAHPGRYVRFPSSSRGGGHTAGSVTQPAPRQGSVAPARFFFRFRRFR